MDIIPERIANQQPKKLVGTSVPRTEDLALLTGTARFIDDLKFPNMLYGKILRSPKAHARVKVDTSAAAGMPGVHDVMSGPELLGKVKPWGDIMQDLLVGDHFPFAIDKVMYEGQELAAVVADTKYQALDALEAIEVEYEDLPVMITAESALADDAPLIQEGINYEFGDGNIFDRYRVRIGDIDAAEADADIVVAQRFSTNRQAGAALDPHGCIANYDSFDGSLTLYSSTQSIFMLRDNIADTLQMPRNKVRVIAPEVGAGFGSKVQAFAHEVIACIFSMRLGRPVHMVLSRADIFRCGTARTGQIRHAELFLKKTGEITGYREYIIQNSGALSHWGNQVVHIGTNVGLLPYPIPNLHIDGEIVHTNTAPGGALRGFGIPQIIFAKEQLVEMAAEKLGLDPLDIRAMNTITRAQCPTVTPIGQRVDSTSIDECLQKAALEIKWKEIRANKPKNEGVGMAISMKYTSCRHPSFDTDLSAIRLRLETDGTVTIFSSDVTHGQGHATFLGQIVSDVLGVGFEKITLARPDTANAPFGLGTYASRAAAVLGTACRTAAERLREKIVAIAAHVLEADPQDLETGNDRVFVRGMSDSGLYLENLASFSVYRTHQLPPGFEPTLESVATYDTPTDREGPDGSGNFSVTYAGSSHAAHVRVCEETGRVEILDYVMVHDTGVVINPLIVEGQHHGGFLMGIGMALGEDYVYDSEGHLLNASFADYQAPQAADLPELTHMWEIPAPSLTIPGGQKGAGESGTGPVPAVIANAVAHATGIRFTELPITPDRVLLAMRARDASGKPDFRYPDDMPDFDGPRDVASWPKPKGEMEMFF
jgi:carbon-monoxide dehydrogenase large subunit